MAQMCHIHRIPLHSSLPLFQLAVLHIPPSLYTTECKDSRSPSQVLLAEVLHYNHHHLLIENKDRVKKCSRKKPVDKHVQCWSYTPRYIYIFLSLLTYLLYWNYFLKVLYWISTWKWNKRSSIVALKETFCFDFKFCFTNIQHPQQMHLPCSCKPRILTASSKEIKSICCKSC